MLWTYNTYTSFPSLLSSPSLESFSYSLDVMSAVEKKTGFCQIPFLCCWFFCSPFSFWILAFIFGVWKWFCSASVGLWTLHSLIPCHHLILLQHCSKIHFSLPDCLKEIQELFFQVIPVMCEQKSLWSSTRSSDGMHGGECSLDGHPKYQEKHHDYLISIMTRFRLTRSFTSQIHKPSTLKIMSFSIYLA